MTLCTFMNELLSTAGGLDSKTMACKTVAIIDDNPRVAPESRVPFNLSLLDPAPSKQSDNRWQGCTLQTFDPSLVLVPTKPRPSPQCKTTTLPWDLLVQEHERNNGSNILERKEIASPMKPMRKVAWGRRNSTVKTPIDTKSSSSRKKKKRPSILVVDEALNMLRTERDRMELKVSQPFLPKVDSPLAIPKRAPENLSGGPEPTSRDPCPFNISLDLHDGSIISVR